MCKYINIALVALILLSMLFWIIFSVVKEDRKKYNLRRKELGITEVSPEDYIEEMPTYNRQKHIEEIRLEEIKKEAEEFGKSYEKYNKAATISNIVEGLRAYKRQEQMEKRDKVTEMKAEYPLSPSEAFEVTSEIADKVLPSNTPSIAIINLDDIPKEDLDFFSSIKFKNGKLIKLPSKEKGEAMSKDNTGKRTKINKNILLKLDGTITNIEPENPKRGFTLAELYALINTTIIEVYHTNDGRLIIMDEEGKLKSNAKINLSAMMLAPHLGPIVGNVVICEPKYFK